MDKFAKALEDLIDRFVTDAADRAEAMEEIMGALELKLEALKEEQDEAGDDEDEDKENA